MVYPLGLFDIMKNPPTIVACATARGISALAIVRVSGKQSHAIVSTCIVEKSKFSVVSQGQISLYKITNPVDNTVVDEVTLIKYEAPKSYTGENMVEIFTHGNPIIVDQIISLLLNAGAVSAQAGEFTRRAFLNGKTTIHKAESIHQIISSRSDISIRNAFRSFYGQDLSFPYKIKENILGILSIIENHIEFAEEEDSNEEGVCLDISIRCDTLKEFIQREIQKKKALLSFEERLDIVILGPANAGKSSIMNLLLGYDRAIVHESAGTTRDFISETVCIKGKQIRFIDTAGFNDNPDEIEKAGINISTEFFSNAPFVLWVSAANTPISKIESQISPVDNQTILVVINKTDLASPQTKQLFFLKKNIKTISLSAISSEYRGTIEAFVADCIISDSNPGFDHCDIGNQRQMEAILEILEIIQDASEIKALEISAIKWRTALARLDDFVGTTPTDEIIDSVFSQFCVGK